MTFGCAPFSGGLCNLEESRSTGVLEFGLEFGTDGVENFQGQPPATPQKRAKAAATRLATTLQKVDKKPSRAKRGTAGTFAGRRPPKSPSKLKVPRPSTFLSNSAVHAETELYYFMLYQGFTPESSPDRCRQIEQSTSL